MNCILHYDKSSASEHLHTFLILDALPTSLIYTLSFQKPRWLKKRVVTGRNGDIRHYSMTHIGQFAPLFPSRVNYREYFDLFYPWKMGACTQSLLQPAAARFLECSGFRWASPQFFSCRRFPCLDVLWLLPLSLLNESRSLLSPLTGDRTSAGRPGMLGLFIWVFISRLVGARCDWWMGVEGWDVRELLILPSVSLQIVVLYVSH